MDDKEAPATAAQGEVTALLQRRNAGDVAARDRLFAIVYDELREMAAAFMRRERADHTLQPTALVNEAYLRFAGTSLENRRHLFGVAARAMWRVLVNHARARKALKRPPADARVPLDDVVASYQARDIDIPALDRALDVLEEMDGALAEVFLLRGVFEFSTAEIASKLGYTEVTVTHMARKARRSILVSLESAR